MQQLRQLNLGITPTITLGASSEVGEDFLLSSPKDIVKKSVTRAFTHDLSPILFINGTPDWANA